jgi:hypothetical protein
MASLEQIAAAEEVIGGFAAVEVEAASIASAFRNLNSFAALESDIIKSNMNELRDVLGAEGRNTSSLGRPPWSLSSKSLAQQTFEKILGEKSAWPLEMKAEVKALRERVIDKSAAEQKYALRLMKQEFDKVKFANYEKELKGIEQARTAALNDLDSDIQDLDVFLRGKAGARDVGKVMDAGEARFDIRDRACATAAGLAYSRYLERGERASLQLLEAAAFVGGRRRRSPRKSADAYFIARDEDQRAALYGTCLDFNGVTRFTTDAKNWMLGRSLVRSAVSSAENSLAAMGRLDTETAAVIAAVEKGEVAGLEMTPFFEDAPSVTDEDFSLPDANPIPEQARPYGPNGANGQSGLPEMNPNAAGVPTSSWWKKGVDEIIAALTPPVVEGGPFAQFANKLDFFVGIPLKKAFNFFRDRFTRIVYMSLTAFTAFMAFEVFNQMAKEKSGCYVQRVGTDGSLQSSTKICHDATWPDTWSSAPNRKIKENCQDCYQVYESGWAPSQVPQNLRDNGCTEVGDPNQRACRSRRNEEGFNYHWDSYSAVDAMGATIASFERFLGGCLECATKLAATALSGGIMSIVAIVVILIILYASYHIYKTITN